MASSLAAPPGVTMGIERHTDAGLLTVLVQDTVSALQAGAASSYIIIVRKGDRWYAVTSPNSALHPFRDSNAGAPPSPQSTALTINVGDMLQ
eukprot:5961109-Pyramimonas_sp.AAC.1